MQIVTVFIGSSGSFRWLGIKIVNVMILIAVIGGFERVNKTEANISMFIIYFI